MSEDADRSRLMHAAAAFLELRIDPPLDAEVAQSLVQLQLHAARVMGFALPPEGEPAPVFAACPVADK